MKYLCNSFSCQQNKKLFVNVFAGPARELFFANTHRHMRCEELVKVITDEYDNEARQLAAQSELERLTFYQAMIEGDSKRLDAGLTYLVDKIHCSEEHKNDSSARQFSTQTGLLPLLHK